MSFLFQKNTSKPSLSESIFAKQLIQNNSSYLYDPQTNENVQNKSIENNPGFSFQNIPIQPKLKVSQPDDPYEREADRVADQIIMMSSPNVASSSVSQIHRKCSSCSMKEDEELKIHRKTQSSSVFEVSDETTNKINTSQGRPLDSSTKSFMEPRFGYDFSKVRIHNDSKANELADSVNARAFTTGNHIFIGKNESAFDKKLMGHELTHVIQQRNTQQISNSNKFLQRSEENEECTVCSGIPNTDCSAYSANAWWLPLAYVNNATCACSRTPNASKYNCIRKSLQDRLRATPTAIKIFAASQKLLLEVSNPILYNVFVQAVLTPLIYFDHVNAYNDACCCGSPAPYPAWIGVTTVPLPCAAVELAIKWTGTCGCIPGRW